jgi:hypothetical protein
MYVIGGEAGIGKTRLLTETAALATLEGVAVFTVRCQAYYTTRPLSVFIELVPALREAPGALGVTPHSMASLTALTSHAEDFSERPPDARDDITRSELLLAAINDLVDAVSAEQPLLLAIEDAHWADQDSLRALNRLVQGQTARPLVIACTTRTPETFPRARALEDHTVFRRLKPLAIEAMGELAEQLLPDQCTDATDALVHWSVRMAGGNPLFLQLLCSHYRATGEAYAVPTDVLSAVIRRVEQLSSDCQRVLAICAMLGKHANIDLLSHLTGWDHLVMFDAVQHLEDQGYLQLDADALMIAHDLVSQAVLSLITPISKRVLHASVATALEQRYDVTSDTGLLWDCAVQWEQSGDPTKAVEFLIRCAKHASRMGKASEALKLLSRAEQMVRFPTQRVAVLRECILTARAARQWASTTEFAKKLNVLQPDIREHSSYELAVHQALWSGLFAGKESVSRLLRCATAPDATISHRIEACHLLLCIAHETGNVRLGAEAFACAEGLLDPALGTSSNRTLAVVYETCIGNRYRGRELIDTLIEHQWHFDSVVDELRTGLVASGALVMLGHTDDAVKVAQRCFEKANALSLPMWQSEFATHICTIYCIREEVAEAQRWLQSVSEEALQQLSACALRHQANRIELAIMQGEEAAALHLLDKLNLSDLGDSLRGKAYFRCLETRCRQLDPSFQVDDATLNEIRQLFEVTKFLCCADGIALAYTEALRRRGRIEEMRNVLHVYLEVDRRELGPLTPSFARHVAQWYRAEVTVDSAGISDARGDSTTVQRSEFQSWVD